MIDQLTGSLAASLRLERKIIVLEALIVVLLALWLLGLVTSYTLGGLIHILLVIAIVVVLVRIIQGRNPLRG
jgi:4-hydroxybenzoate polyprenyltransferase